MPTMYRLDSQNTKIAYKILGEPQNLAAKKTNMQRYIDRRLIADETTRAR